MTDIARTAAVQTQVLALELGITESAQKEIIQKHLVAMLAMERERERPWPEREPGVAEIIARWAEFINARPMLLSLLYDIDMLPEQCVTYAGSIRLAGLCEVWKHGEEGRLPPPPQPLPSPPEGGDQP